MCRSRALQRVPPRPGQRSPGTVPRPAGLCAGSCWAGPAAITSSWPRGPQSFGAVLVGHSPTQRWLSAVQKRSGWLPQGADKECASVKLRSGVNAGLRGGFLPSSVDFQACVWHGKFAYRDSHPIQVSTCILCPHSFSTLA